MEMVNEASSNNFEVLKLRRKLGGSPKGDARHVRYATQISYRDNTDFLHVIAVALHMALALHLIMESLSGYMSEESSQAIDSRKQVHIPNNECHRELQV